MPQRSASTGSNHHYMTTDAEEEEALQEAIRRSMAEAEASAEDNAPPAAAASPGRRVRFQDPNDQLRDPPEASFPEAPTGESQHSGGAPALDRHLAQARTQALQERLETALEDPKLSAANRGDIMGMLQEMHTWVGEDGGRVERLEGDVNRFFEFQVRTGPDVPAAAAGGDGPPEENPSWDPQRGDAGMSAAGPSHPHIPPPPEYEFADPASYEFHTEPAHNADAARAADDARNGLDERLRDAGLPGVGMQLPPDAEAFAWGAEAAQLIEMGFDDESRNRMALTQCKGDVQAAMDWILTSQVASLASP